MARIIQAGSDYATDGERRAAEELAKLPAAWTVIANKTLATSNGRSFELDFVVIGDRLVFLIDEKSWRGRIHGTDAIWVRDDGSSEKSPLGKVDYVAKVLAGHLRAKTVGFAQLQGHPVVGCVLLSRATERPHLRDPRAAHGVILLADAVDALRQRDAGEGDPKVGSLRSRIEGTLVDLTSRPKVPRAIGPYAITEAASGPGGARVFRAEHEQGGTRRLTMYDIASGDTALRDFHLQEYRALAELRGTGVVPDVGDPFMWSDDFLVVPSMPAGGVSLSAIPRPDSEDAVLAELERTVAAFRALARIHAAGVVHRAIGPETVHVGERDGGLDVMFSGFFAARRGDQTISPRLDELTIEDPYVAPEIVIAGSYGFATPESDVFSLALVFLERLSGVPVSRLRAPEGAIRVPGADKGWSFLPQAAAEATIACFRAALTRGLAAPPGSDDATRLTADECAERLGDIVRNLRGATGVVQGDLLDGRYRVERVLGVGASARTLLATDTEADGLFALKQFLRPAVIGETKEARREFEVLRKYPHPHLPRVYDVYPMTSDAHVKLEYVEGVRLSDMLPTYAGDLDRWRRLADNLLAAVEHLEQHQLLHRDIKPDNVVIRDGSGEAVLIDFGAATAVGTETSVAGTPGYLPPEAYLAEAPPPTTDLYALGVLLFRALTGQMPFREEGSVFEQQPIEGVDFLPEAARPFARVLLQVVDRDPDNRFPSAAAFRDALLTAPTPTSSEDEDGLRREINPTVDLLRGLFRNSARGNADNRGLDSEFARETYVPTALDERLLPAIFERRPRAVFLSGNPGDGKTAFLGQVQHALEARGARQVEVDESGWVWELDGHTYRACYDASEAHAGKSADEQVRHRLKGLEGEAPARSDLTVLVAINDGRLADLADKSTDDFGWLSRQIEAAHHASHPLDPGGVWLIDLKRRAYVGLAPNAQDRSVMRRVLHVLANPRRWEICEGCLAKHICPIRHNALALGAAGDEPAADRLEHLMLLSHLREQRHVTIRDLRSGLAYLLTGDLGCDDIHQARETEKPMPAATYWRNAFTTDAARDIMLGELVPLDPARHARPRLERSLYFHRNPADAPYRAALFTDDRDLPPSVDAVDWLAQMKRRLYFEARNPGTITNGTDAGADWRTLLPYRHAEEFIAVLVGEHDPAAMLPRIARGIGRSDGLSGAALDEGLCLRVAHSDATRLTVLKRFAIREFGLTVRRPPASEMIEALPRALVLTHRPTNARLDIPLDLFEMLLRLADGLEPGGHELQPLLEDLAPFKNAVQLSNTKDLILVEGGRRMHELTQRDGKVVRTAMQAGK